MLEKWKTRDGSIVEIDSIAFNGRLKIGSVHPPDSKDGARCIWDAHSGQAWGKDGWDLEKELPVEEVKY